jgi:DNA-binding MarR family transcriptional regulator
LSTAQFWVLLHLSLAEDSLTPSVLATLLIQEVQSISALVYRLELRQLVERARHPLDRRSVLLRLSPQGEKLFAEALDAFMTVVRAFQPGTLDGGGVLSDLEGMKAAALFASVNAAPLRRQAQAGRKS